MILLRRAAVAAAFLWLVYVIGLLSRENAELWKRNDDLVELNTQLVKRVRRPLIP